MSKKETVIWWCLHCERTYTGDADAYWCCEYEDCDGHIGDIREWESIREMHPSYPEFPEHGKQYPMY